MGMWDVWRVSRRLHDALKRYDHISTFKNTKKKGPTFCGQIWEALARYFSYGTVAHDIFTVFLAIVCYAFIGYVVIVYSVIRTPSREASQQIAFVTTLVIPLLALCAVLSRYFRCLAVLWLRDTLVVRLRWLIMLSLCAFAVAGPLHNATNNMKLAAVTFSCVRSEMRSGVKAATAIRPDFTRQAYWKKVLDMIGKQMSWVIWRYKQLVLSIQRVHNLYVATKAWLSSFPDNCKKFYIVPYQMCYQTAINWGSKPYGFYNYFPIWTDWTLKLTSWTNTYIVKMWTWNCNVLRVLPVLGCMLPDAVKTIIYSAPVYAITEKIAQLFDKLKYVFDPSLSVEGKWTYDVQYNVTTKLPDIFEILEKVTDAMNSVRDAFYTFMYWLASLSVFSGLAIKSFYLWRYLNTDYFDNYIITKSFEEYDKQKAKKEGTGVLPLYRAKEVRTYIKPFSPSLARKECIYFCVSFILLCVPLAMPIAFIFMDMLVWWGLRTVVNYFTTNSELPTPPFVSIKPASPGNIIWRVIKQITQSIMPFEGNKLETWSHCFADPNEPDFKMYQYMGLSVAACVLLLMCDVYSWRLNQWICGCYYPDRAKYRGAYMHFEIVTSRRTFTHAFMEQGWRGAMKLAFVKLPVLQSTGVDMACPGRCANCLRIGPKEDYKYCERKDCKASVCGMCYSGRETCPKCMNPFRIDETGLWIEVWDPDVVAAKDDAN